MKKAPKTSVLGAFVVQTSVLISDDLALAELRRATGGFEAVLNSFERRFSLVFRAFPAFQCSVVLFLNQGKWCIFNQHPAS